MKRLTGLVVFVFLVSLGVNGFALELNEKDDKEAKAFKFFDWTISFDKEDKKKTEDQLEDEVEKFIRTTDDKEVVRERERVKRAKARIQKRKDREIDQADRIREAEIKKAKGKADSRMERAKNEAKERVTKLEENLRQLALKKLKEYNQKLPEDTEEDPQ